MDCSFLMIIIFRLCLVFVCLLWNERVNERLSIMIIEMPAIYSIYSILFRAFFFSTNYSIECYALLSLHFVCVREKKSNRKSNKSMCCTHNLTDFGDWHVVGWRRRWRRLALIVFARQGWWRTRRWYRMYVHIALFVAAIRRYSCRKTQRFRPLRQAANHLKAISVRFFFVVFFSVIWYSVFEFNACDWRMSQWISLEHDVIKREFPNQT